METNSSLPDAQPPIYPPCLARIRSRYDELTRSECQIADYILNNPFNILQFPINKFAEHIGVGLATVSRLPSKLGYKDFMEMKLALAIELYNPEQKLVEDVTIADLPASTLDKVLRIEMQALHETRGFVDPAEFERATLAIAQAKRVDCYGSGGISAPMAEWVHSCWLDLRITSAALVHPHQQMMSAELLTPQDVALGLFHSADLGSSVPHALLKASRFRAKTICVTNDPQSPAAKIAGIVLLMATPPTSTWGNERVSRIAMQAVLNALYVAVALELHRQQASQSDS